MKSCPVEFEPIDEFCDGLHIVGDHHDEEGTRHHLVRAPSSDVSEYPRMWRNAVLWKEQT